MDPVGVPEANPHTGSRAGWIGVRILAVETLKQHLPNSAHPGIRRFSEADDLLPLARSFTTQVLPEGWRFFVLIRDKQGLKWDSASPDECPRGETLPTAHLESLTCLQLV